MKKTSATTRDSLIQPNILLAGKRNVEGDFPAAQIDRVRDGTGWGSALEIDLLEGSATRHRQCSGTQAILVAEFERAIGYARAATVGIGASHRQFSGARFGQAAADAGQVAGPCDVLAVGIHAVELTGISAEAAGVVGGVRRSVLKRAAAEGDGARGAESGSAGDGEFATVDAVARGEGVVASSRRGRASRR